MKKLTLAEMKVIAKKRKGLCLSSSYKHSKTKLRWQCSKGHTWDAAPSSVKMGNWCKLCAVKKIADKRRFSLTDIKKMAKLKNGQCLSTKYEGNKNSKLHWKCKAGHEWKASVGKVRNSGSWCPICARLNRRLKITDMKKLAHSRGGRCLSNSYNNTDTKLHWQCAKGHEWNATAHHIKNQGCWCPHCAGRYNLSIEKMHTIAQSRGGKCLSKKTINSITKLHWQCARNHRWRATPNDILSAHWCRKCAAKTRADCQRTSLEEINQLAKARGGECLSKKYDDSSKKLHWQCFRQHTWKASLRNIKHKKSWCPICSNGISERFCRAIFEALFSTPFPCSKFSWLLNARGNQMHLDGYAKKIKLAFEYQGVQHFKRSYFFHKSYKDFLTRQKDDKKKLTLCRKAGITLITIPYTTPLNQKIEQLIRSKCKKAGIMVPKQEAVNIANLSIYNDDPLEKLKAIATARGGALLSTTYINRDTKMHWQCSVGHKWAARAGAIKNAGQWCPLCGIKRRAAAQTLTIDAMHSLAKTRSGKFLSKKYIGTRLQYKWQCRQGHQWKATANNIRNGSWCKKCSVMSKLQ